jgi:hypothetical protein
MSYQFPLDTCVVACSGPSLNKVDVFSLGVPVCAISTTIRSIPKPDYWFIADHLNEMHGQQGKDGWEDPSIIKVVPSKSMRNGAGKNVIQHPYLEGREANQKYESLLFDPTKPLLRGPHKTLTFAIQWLHVCGVKNIIFAGNDLSAEKFESKYAYGLESYDKKKEHNFKKTLDQIKDALIGWYPVARSKGYNWYSLECGPIFESIVPRFNPEILNNVNTCTTVVPVPKDIEEQIIYDNMTEHEKNQREYFRLLNEARAKEKEKQNKNINMSVYFDLLQKRRK